MIYLDTDRLQQMVGTLESANQRIDEVTNILMQITTHDDWGCAERHQINDYILKNKTMIQTLQSTGGGFYSIMKQVAGEFIETENNIGNLFSGLEGVLSKILSVAVIGISGNVTIDAVNTVHSTIGHIGNTINDIISVIVSDDSWNPIDIPEDIIETVDIGNIQWDIISDYIESAHTGIPWQTDTDISWIPNWDNSGYGDGVAIFNLKDFEI